MKSKILITVFSLCQIFNLSIQAAPNTREYYDLLGVKQNAKLSDIKRAWRKLSQEWHPDVNPDPQANEKFSKINNAYEVLNDPEKRRKYDQFGEEGLRDQVEQQDPFADFFGGGRRSENKGPELPIKIRATLEDIYNGKEVRFFLTKQIICPHCRGTGADDPDDVHPCPECNGKGFVIKKQQIAPGFFQQFQGPCEKCFGKGKIYKKKCHVCKGDKIIPGSDELALYIEKGIADRQTIRFDGGGSEYADKTASDIIFQIILIPHKVFTRKENDLYSIVNLTLEEALLGFYRKIKHLDGHYVEIKRSHVTQPGETERIKGQGMPHHQFSSNFGDLIIEYSVKIDARYNEEQLNSVLL